MSGKVSGETDIKILCKKFGFKISGRSGSHVRLSKMAPEGKVGTIRDGYSFGTDDRAIREYITKQSRDMKKGQSLRNIYYMIVSSKFTEDYDETICSIKMDTHVNEVALVEAEAFVAMVDAKLRDPLQMTSEAMGFSDSFQLVVLLQPRWYENN